METSRPNWLQSYFAHPVGFFRLDNLETLNLELKKIILNSENSTSKNDNPSQKIQPEVFESKFNFLEWPIPAVTNLRTGFINRLTDVICQITQFDKNELKNLSFGCSSWFHITRRGGYVQPHDHPNASWSIVYCVCSGDKDEEHQSSGSLIMQNPAGGVNMYKDPCNNNFNGEFNQNARKFTLEAGDMVIFPSYLFHWVSPYMGNGERITVASNWWFKHNK